MKTPIEIAREVLEREAEDKAPEVPRYLLTDSELAAWMAEAITCDRLDRAIEEAEANEKAIQAPAQPEPHLASQPGIRGHSYDAEHALGERYRVVDLVGNSRTYVASRSSLLVAIRKAESLCLERKRDYRVEDAHGGNLIVADVTYQPRTNRAHVTRP